MPAYRVPYPLGLTVVLSGEEPSCVLVKPALWYCAVYGRLASSQDYQMIVWSWNPFNGETKVIPLAKPMYRRGLLRLQSHWIWLEAFENDGRQPALWVQPVLDLGYDPPKLLD